MTNAFRLALVLAVTGCSFLTPTPDPTRLYILTTTTRATADSSTHLVIGLGPVTVPHYLDRPEIMTRIGTNEIKPSPFDRWGEPLSTQVARTIGNDLTALLRAERVVPYPWYTSRDFAAIVEVDMLRFESKSDGTALVVARWRVRPPKGTARTGLFVRNEPATGGADATVAALSRMVGALSEEIADAVHDVSAHEAPARAAGRARPPRPAPEDVEPPPQP